MVKSPLRRVAILINLLLLNVTHFLKLFLADSTGYSTQCFWRFINYLSLLHCWRVSRVSSGFGDKILASTTPSTHAKERVTG